MLPIVLSVSVDVLPFLSSAQLALLPVLVQLIAEIKNDVTELKGDVAELKRDVTELKKDVAELKRDVAELKGDVAELKKDVAANSPPGHCIIRIQTWKCRLQHSESERRKSYNDH